MILMWTLLGSTLLVSAAFIIHETFARAAHTIDAITNTRSPAGTGLDNLPAGETTKPPRGDR